MFVYQAEVFRLWHKVEPNITKETLKLLENDQNSVVGDIGSEKTFVANNFGYPVFSADLNSKNL